MTSLSQRYAENGFKAIEVDGEASYPFYERPIAVGEKISIQWISVGTRRPQGLSLRVRLPGVPGPAGYAGTLHVVSGAANAPSIALWEATSPRTVEVVCADAKPEATLQISNQWRVHKDGRADEWLNNYGMRIEPQDDTNVLLRCSDGYSTPDYENLVVRLILGQQLNRACE